MDPNPGQADEPFVPPRDQPATDQPEQTYEEDIPSDDGDNADEASAQKR